jgi:hypothetical protein
MNFFKSLFQKKEDSGAAKQKPSYTEKRKHPRSLLNENTFLYPPRRPPAQVRVLDISPGGVRIELREPLPLDTKAELALYCGGVVSKTMIMLKWELKQKTGFVYGAVFVDLDPRQKGLIMQYIRQVTGQ